MIVTHVVRRALRKTLRSIEPALLRIVNALRFSRPAPAAFSRTPLGVAMAHNTYSTDCGCTGQLPGSKLDRYRTKRETYTLRHAYTLLHFQVLCRWVPLPRCLIAGYNGLALHRIDIHIVFISLMLTPVASRAESPVYRLLVGQCTSLIARYQCHRLRMCCSSNTAQPQHTSSLLRCQHSLLHPCPVCRLRRGHELAVKSPIYR